MAIAPHFLMSSLNVSNTRSSISSLNADQAGPNTNSGSDRPYHMTRYMGGHKRTTQPYVSGYWYFMINPPATIFTEYDNDNIDVAQWLHSTAESFTPPSTNLTKIDIPGMGGIGSSFIGGREITRTFTIGFREYTGLPIINTLKKWNSIMDPYLGVSALNYYDWNPSAYKGTACAFLARPTVSDDSRQKIIIEDIEQLYYFDGVWPEGAPDDSFNSDIATNDSVQLSVSFAFDGWAYHKEAMNGKIGDQAIAQFNAKGFNLEEIIRHIENNVIDSA